MILLAACAEPDTIVVEASSLRTVELVLDPGRLDEGWISAPVGEDRLVEPPGSPGEGAGRHWVSLPPGPGRALVRRVGCGPVVVPFEVPSLGRTVVLPYPSCAEADALPIPGRAARLDRREAGWATVAAVAALGLWPGIPAPEPGAENGPARYVDLAEARAWCAWNGGRLPTLAEWEAAAGPDPGLPRRAEPSGPGDLDRAPAIGPGGHEDLWGNVEEWLEDGRVAGGSWLRSERVRDVPDNARAETIGLRCAWD